MGKVPLGTRQTGRNGPPWDRRTPQRPLCQLHRGTMVHQRFIHCLRWKVATMRISIKGPWQDYVT